MSVSGADAALQRACGGAVPDVSSGGGLIHVALDGGEIGEITVTECEAVNRFSGSNSEPPRFTRAYGRVFGQTGGKAIAMALVDRALRWRDAREDDGEVGKE